MRKKSPMKQSRIPSAGGGKWIQIFPSHNSPLKIETPRTNTKGSFEILRPRKKYQSKL